MKNHKTPDWVKDMNKKIKKSKISKKELRIRQIDDDFNYNDAYKK